MYALLLYCIPLGPFHFLQLGHDFYITFGAAAYMRAKSKYIQHNSSALDEASYWLCQNPHTHNSFP
jgi:hypothetical protein